MCLFVLLQAEASVPLVAAAFSAELRDGQLLRSKTSSASLQEMRTLHTLQAWYDVSLGSAACSWPHITRRVCKVCCSEVDVDKDHYPPEPVGLPLLWHVMASFSQI